MRSLREFINENIVSARWFWFYLDVVLISQYTQFTKTILKGSVVCSRETQDTIDRLISSVLFDQSVGWKGAGGIA